MISTGQRLHEEVCLDLQAEFDLACFALAETAFRFSIQARRQGKAWLVSEDLGERIKSSCARVRYAQDVAQDIYGVAVVPCAPELTRLVCVAVKAARGVDTVGCLSRAMLEYARRVRR